MKAEGTAERRAIEALKLLVSLSLSLSHASPFFAVPRGASSSPLMPLAGRACGGRREEEGVRMERDESCTLPPASPSSYLFPPSSRSLPGDPTPFSAERWQAPPYPSALNKTATLLQEEGASMNSSWGGLASDMRVAGVLEPVADSSVSFSCTCSPRETRSLYFLYK